MGWYAAYAVLFKSTWVRPAGQNLARPGRTNYTVLCGYRQSKPHSIHGTAWDYPGPTECWLDIPIYPAVEGPNFYGSMGEPTYPRLKTHLESNSWTLGPLCTIGLAN